LYIRLKNYICFRSEIIQKYILYCVVLPGVIPSSHVLLLVCILQKENKLIIFKFLSTSFIYIFYVLLNIM